MSVSDESLKERLELGEDSGWEFKHIEFRGDKPLSAQRSDLADEMIAFANSEGGIILCGVTDDGKIQNMSLQQMKALDRWLSEISMDIVKPPLHVGIHHRKLDNKIFVLVEVFRGITVHERSGNAYIRVGETKRKLDSDERLRFAQNRAQSRYQWFDNQIVEQTGFETLNERLWLPLLSDVGLKDPRQALLNLRLLTKNESGMIRATVAGVLLCTKYPQTWFPQAIISATHYRGEDRASGHLDAQDIEGPLHQQVADALRFVFRNMRVAARKLPEREEIPQYSKKAVFEAVVNAVVHRDYSIFSRRIRLSLFNDRLEIDSPGKLPNGVNLDNMVSSQSTRNNVIASVFGRLSTVEVPGAKNRRFLMERRGDGVSIILRETKQVSGDLPEYEIIGDSNLVLSIPAASLELTPDDCKISVHSEGEPLSGAKVLAIFPNETWIQSVTDQNGQTILELYTTHLPITVFVALRGYVAGRKSEWKPNKTGLLLDISPLKNGGSAILSQGTGYLPGLRGKLTITRDDANQIFLTADQIVIEEGRQQPIQFIIGKPLRLEDSSGIEYTVTIVDIIGTAALVEYRKLPL